MKLKWTERLFSLKRVSRTHRQLCVLGVRIKLRQATARCDYYSDLPIQKNKIVFRSILRGYSCNPKYIAEELMRQNLPYDLVWITDQYVLKSLKYFPPNLRLVMINTQEDLEELSTARVWVMNERMNVFLKKGLKKKEGQCYIQTWHGTFGFKKLAMDRNDVNTISGMDTTRQDAQNVDYLLSNSTFETELYKRHFFGCGKILETGHARNDLFFREDRAEVARRARGELGIPADKKIVLYVPTWREFGETDWLTMDLETVSAALEKRFGGKWAIAIKLHHLMYTARGALKKLPASVYNVTEYPDVQELLVAADVVITDYSSCILDFLLTRRPGFIYAPDRARYEKKRGLYYPLEEAPFPIAEDNAGLVKNISEFDAEKYSNRVEAFLIDKGCREDGHATERAVALIKDIMSD